MPFATNHAFLLHVIEQGDGRVPEALHIVEDDHLVMIADGVGGGNGENLIERADATRQCHDDVALGEQEVLAVAQIVARYLHIEVIEGFSTFLHQAWHHADGSAAICLHCLADAIHQSHVAAAEDDIVTILTHPLAQFLGHGEEVGVDISVC